MDNRGIDRGRCLQGGARGQQPKILELNGQMHVSLCHFCGWERLSSSGHVSVCLGVLVACMWLVHESMNPPAAQISTIPQTIHLSNLLANKSAYLSFYQPICHVSDRSNYLSIYLSIYVFSAEKLTVRKLTQNRTSTFQSSKHSLELMEQTVWK